MKLHEQEIEQLYKIMPREGKLKIFGDNNIK